MRCPLAELAATRPHAACLRSVEHTLSTAAADREAAVRAGALNRCGVARRDRIAILAHNSIDYALLLIAAYRIGVGAVVLNTRLDARSWMPQLEESGAKLVCGDAALLAQLGDGLPRLSFTELAAYDPAPYDAAAPAPEQEAVVVYTSGSTGRGKGVSLSFGNLTANASASNAVTGLGPSDSWLLALPLFHVGGLGILYRCLLSGAAAFIHDRANAAAVHSLLGSGLSHLSLVPTILEELLERGAEAELCALRMILLGGAPPSSRLIERAITARIPLRTSYGMTESASHVTAARADDSPEALRSAGAPLPTATVRILNPEGEECAPGIAGEVALGGPMVFAQYLGGVPRRTAGELFLTGDQGYFDLEGNLNLLGRRDGMFISGGENIYPEEIANEALSLEEVAAAAVVAVPDPRWGERPVLFVELKEGRSARSEELQALLEPRLPPMKRPGRIIVGEIPRTALGKVDYAALRRLL